MSATAIIIPCYNEGKRLNKQAFLSFLTNNKNYNLFLVDDGSTDNTFKVLTELETQNSTQITTLKNDKNLGKGESVRNGMIAAYNAQKFAQIGFLDADLSTPLTEFVSLTDFLILHNKKAVFGSRLKRVGATIERSSLRHFVGRFIATLISWTIKIPFYDTQCGAKVFSSDVIPSITSTPFLSRWLFDVEIILRLKKLLEKEVVRLLYEYPINEWKAVDGSKITWKDSFRIPVELLRIKRNS
ncbi:MAG: glycosyltransferase [Flavobacteriales bacterium]|nr:glycosyltransferase [Flavobacteriales bacterium]MCW8911698.1 glycosyltransferase [Flavobacteriales bacterium]MCW8936957.1 glycosyltransferase [Flavobacteriales bacterium]MCW8939196.1 glycosyltransferase [Flavobacteriales bacterium]MCW8968743.1 glycosyltransferase [Flavobacteriales bacterium]